MHLDVWLYYYTLHFFQWILANYPKRKVFWKLGRRKIWKNIKWSVPCCWSNYDGSTEGVSTLKLPNNPALWQKCVKTNRKDFVPSENLSVCVKHFDSKFILYQNKAVRGDGVEIYTKCERCILFYLSEQPQYLTKTHQVFQILISENFEIKFLKHENQRTLLKGFVWETEIRLMENTVWSCGQILLTLIELCVSKHFVK